MWNDNFLSWNYKIHVQHIYKVGRLPTIQNKYAITGLVGRFSARKHFTSIKITTVKMGRSWGIFVLNLFVDFPIINKKSHYNLFSYNLILAFRKMPKAGDLVANLALDSDQLMDETLAMWCMWMPWIIKTFPPCCCNSMWYLQPAKERCNTP